MVMAEDNFSVLLLLPTEDPVRLFFFFSVWASFGWMFQRWMETSLPFWKIILHV